MKTISLLLCLTFPVDAQGPSASLVGATYDAARGRTVIVGGGMGSSSLAETWEWDGVAWTRAAVAGPSGREEPLLAYDRRRKETVLFGGYRGAELKNDTWTWDGTVWQRVATDGPSPRSAATMTYDSQRGRIVLFGGLAGAMGSRLYNDLWEWDGTRWRRIIENGQAGSPPARALHAMAYDEARGRIVLAGGFSTENGSPRPFNDTWEFDGSAWHQIDIAGPGARDHLAMVYAPDRHGVIMQGGARPDIGLMGDTWCYDGTSWTKVLAEGPPRGRHRLVYDDRTKAVLLYGGWGPKTQLSELWELKDRGWVQVAR